MSMRLDVHPEICVQALWLRLFVLYERRDVGSPTGFIHLSSRHAPSLTRSWNIAYWIAFGPHGPRALPPPGENWYVFKTTMLCIGISIVLFCAIRMFARPAPKTMTAQYQEMSNEYLKVRYANKHARGIMLPILSLSY